MAIKSTKRQSRNDARVARWPADVASLGFTRAAKGDFAALQKEILGEVVLPGDPEYDAAREQNPLYPAFPKAIVFCEAFSDVRACLKLARDTGLEIACRSGRHNTAGFSTNDGLVIDTSRLAYVAVDADRRRARVGAGTPFATLNAQLDVFGLHVPGGTCGDVCVAGFMQGGGYGFTSRTFGMGCDAVIGARVMLADGRIVDASPQRNADLLWAIRGGTGNNFGVLLELDFALHRLSTLFGFAIAWPLADAPRVLAALQAGYMDGDNDRRVGYLAIFATLGGQRVLLMIGMFHGDEAEAKRALAPLTSLGSPTWHKGETGRYAALNTSLLDVLPGPGEPTTRELKEARYVSRRVPQTAWGALCEQFAATPNDYNIVAIEAYGGKINARPKLWSAFVHRDVSMNFFVDSFFDATWKTSKDRDTAQRWMDGIFDAVRPHLDDHVYQNYPRRDLADYRWAYWGDAFPTLLFVKRKLDPGNLFRYAQSVSPYPEEAAIRRSTVGSIFRDAEIEGGLDAS